MFCACDKTLMNVQQYFRFSNTHHIYERQMSYGLYSINDKLAGYTGEVYPHPRPIDSTDSSHGIITVRWQDSSTDPGEREKRLQVP